MKHVQSVLPSLLIAAGSHKIRFCRVTTLPTTEEGVRNRLLLGSDGVGVSPVGPLVLACLSARWVEWPRKGGGFISFLPEMTIAVQRNPAFVTGDPLC